VQHTAELDIAWQLHIGPPQGRLDALLARHRERHRRYHTATHVTWVIRHVDELAGLEPVADLGAVVAAAFYHDAVHEPAYPANERASARLARRDLAEMGWSTERVDAVAAMIEGTAHHTEPVDVDTAVLFDADLAVLGAEPAGYSEYVAGIRGEYRHLDDDEWRHGRSQVIRAFLDRTTIFATDTGRTRWEARARANLTAELAALA
jgi:predicted metal-dependent HD superfamily phosphohydrolase